MIFICVFGDSMASKICSIIILYPRGCVDEALHWGYSSTRDYEGIDGLLEIECFW